jgi:hypothetical protein
VPSDVQDHYSHTVPGAGQKAAQFLRIVMERCQELDFGMTLEPARRSRRDGGGDCLHANFGAGQVLEVFAEPQGAMLHVGYQFIIKTVGGPLAGRGSAGEINQLRNWRQGRTKNIRNVEGQMNAFEKHVFGPVVQELTEAMQQLRPTNGFLGA